MAGKPGDHTQRMQRVRLALHGLSTGDALGQQFFRPSYRARLLARRRVPPGPWRYTDDTEMALGIADVLEEAAGIDPDRLARVFAERYARDPTRGYGGMAHRILAAIGSGVPWQQAAPAAFGGQGSMGNGAAMRVAPVGAYFADDLARVVEHADRSAQVTHAHLEGRAGAIATAVAAAAAWRARSEGSPRDLVACALAQTPPGETRRGLARAAALPPTTPVEEAVAVLGNGSAIVAQDTVPFALWCASRCIESYTDAIWTTIRGGGDVDTTCAIVGGIVALFTGREAIPGAWIDAREALEVG